MLDGETYGVLGKKGLVVGGKLGVIGDVGLLNGGAGGVVGRKGLLRGDICLAVGSACAVFGKEFGVRGGVSDHLVDFAAVPGAEITLGDATSCRVDMDAWLPDRFLRLRGGLRCLLGGASCSCDRALRSPGGDVRSRGTHERLPCMRDRSRGAGGSPPGGREHSQCARARSQGAHVRSQCINEHARGADLP